MHPTCLSRFLSHFARRWKLVESVLGGHSAARYRNHFIRESAPAMSQEAFDEWHKQTCDALASAYRREGYEKFYVGQGQKCINMALKYVFVFGEASLPGYSRTYTYCHVPIDNVILEDPEFKELRAFKGPWSRINNYPEYMAFQIAVRKRFKGSSPLAVEFVRWQAQNAV